MRKKKNSELTVMILSDDTSISGIRQFNISISSLRFIWISFILLLSLTVIGLASSTCKIVDWIKLENLSQELVDLSKENEILRRRNRTLISTNEKLGKRLSRMEKLELDIKALVGLTNKNKRVKKRINEAKGGPAKMVYRLSSISLEDPLEKFDAILTQMEEEALERERNLGKIKNFLEKRRRRLAATPSILPVRGRFTSGFGWRRSPFTGWQEFHEGIDIAAPVGVPIYAPADGIVTSVGWENGYGLALRIDHGYGYKTVYGHTSGVRVKKNQRVKRGDIIAFVGNTGRSTGPHLHYEIQVNKKAINPWKCISD